MLSISAGIFSGRKEKKDILFIACKALFEALEESSKSLSLFLIGFTDEEQNILKSVSKNAYEEYISKRHEL